ncbi:ABC transporter substrate-binding protein [Nonomuraea sp. NPDC046570]|uniref:ABC transporter substrate-binding protein n=1 Tax=Nonomuraea sp. NPDC046570 TaxID=3155255 RepID=UPI0033FDC03D
MSRRLVAAVLTLLLTGCATPQVRQEPRAVESTFVYVQNLDVVTDWDPASSYSNEIIALQNVYESLTVYNPVTRKASPRLATSWRTSPDGKAWTFTLRRGVKFHTGRALDANAVKAAIERTMKSDGEPAYIWDAVESIRAENTHTVTFTLKYPVPLDLIASSGYAAYIYDTAAAPDLKKWLAEGRDAGSGPYTVQSWRKGERDELKLKAFDGYWGGWDRPHYRYIVYRVVPDPEIAWRQLLNGEAGFVQRLNPRLFRLAEQTPGVRTSRMPSFQTALMLFNTASGPLADGRLRRAVQKAIDYRGVVDALSGAATPATGIVPEGLLGHLEGRPQRQDLEGAADLLTQAGYGPGGKPLRLSLTYAEGDDDQRLLVTRLATTLKDLNVVLDAKAMPWEEQWAQGKAGGQDIFVMYWFPDYADAYSWFLNVFRGGQPPTFNLTYLTDPVTDKMIDNLPELSATDRRAAQQAYTRLQARLIGGRAVASVPWVVTYQRAYLGGIQGYQDNPAYPDVVFVHALRPVS